MSDQEQLNQELTILAQEDPAGFQRIITGLEEGKPFILENQQLVHDQLIFLIQRDRPGFDRAVQALEDLKLDGREKEYCFLGYYICTQAHKNWVERVIAYNDIRQACSAFIPTSRILTAIELAVLDCRPGQPLTAYEQAFLTLCKEVQQSCSPQATGSEE